MNQASFYPPRGIIYHRVSSLGGPNKSRVSRPIVPKRSRQSRFAGQEVDYMKRAQFVSVG